MFPLNNFLSFSKEKPIQLGFVKKRTERQAPILHKMMKKYLESIETHRNYQIKIDIHGLLLRLSVFHVEDTSPHHNLFKGIHRERLFENIRPNMMRKKSSNHLINSQSSL